MTTEERAKRTYSIYALARDEKGFTDYGVAKSAGVRPSTICDWKMGRYMPKFEKLTKIAAIVDIPVQSFVVEEQA